MVNIVEKHSGRVQGAECDQWHFLPGSYDPLPWIVSEEIGILELILSVGLKPDDAGWFFYKYQVDHQIVYTGYPVTIKAIAHIQTRSFSELCLKVLQSFYKPGVPGQKNTAPENEAEK